VLIVCCVQYLFLVDMCCNRTWGWCLAFVCTCQYYVSVCVCVNLCVGICAYGFAFLCDVCVDACSSLGCYVHVGVCVCVCVCVDVWTC